LYGIRRILLRGAENQSKTSYTRLLTGPAAGDPDDQVATAYIAAQKLRHVYGTIDLAQARTRLFTFYTVCADSSIPKLHRLASTITAWQNRLAYYHRPRQQRTHQSVNLLVKRIKRVGFGFRNFDNYRLPLLLHCGTTWHTQSTTRIRGRSPRLMS
jgi:transposase